MNKSNLLVVLGNIFNCISNEYLKELLLGLFKAIGNNTVSNLDIKYLDLFNYNKTKYEYHNIKNSIELIIEYYDINKYNDIINIIRIANGLGLDNSYLIKLYKELTDINDYNKLNNRFKGLFNLLIDNNLVYNNIGIRILIIQYLLSIDISKLKVYQLDNNRLNSKYSFIVYKNDKIKFFTKLYFIDNDIILSTLNHDNISNVVFTLKDNINTFYGGNIEIQQIENDIKFINNYNKRYRDSEERYLNNIAKIEKIFNFRYNTKSKNVYLTFNDIVKNFFIDIYKNDNLYRLYLDIKQYEIDLDNFKSNDLELLKTNLNDYDNFNYDNLLKDICTIDILDNINTKTNKKYRYKLYISNRMINKSLKGIETKNDIKNKHIKHIIKDLSI